jgi:hypothetical protein
LIRNRVRAAHAACRVTGPGSLFNRAGVAPASLQRHAEGHRRAPASRKVIVTLLQLAKLRGNNTSSRSAILRFYYESDMPYAKQVDLPGSTQRATTLPSRFGCISGFLIVTENVIVGVDRCVMPIS